MVACNDYGDKQVWKSLPNVDKERYGASTNKVNSVKQQARRNSNYKNETAKWTSWASTSCKVRYGNTDCENQSGEAGPKRHLGFVILGACNWTEGPRYGIVLKDMIGGGTKL